MPSTSAVLHLKPRPTRVPLDPADADARALRVESRALLRGAREILIQHGGETYRLRHTRNDKLILTK